MANSLTVTEKEHWKNRIAARIENRIDALATANGGFMEQVTRKARERSLESAGILKLQRAVEKVEKQMQTLDDKTNALDDALDKKKRSIDDKLQPVLEELHKEQIVLETKERQLQDAAVKKKCQREEKLQPVLDEIETQKDALRHRKTQTYRKMLAKVRNEPLRKVSDDPYCPERDIDAAISVKRTCEIDRILAESPRGRKILALRTEKENLLDTVWLATSTKQIKELWQQVDAMLEGQQTKLQEEAHRIEAVGADD
jgi:hypothetical protein